MRSVVLSIAVLVIAAEAFGADEWPQFRGPDGTGHAQAHGLPAEWSESQNVLWKTALPGSGHSSPVVGRGLIWLTTSADQGRSLGVLAVELKSGRIVQQREVLRTGDPPHVNAKNSHASPSPVLDGDRIYVNYGTSGTACLSTATAATLWQEQDLKLDHGEGPGSSPVLWKNLLILTCDGRDVQYVAALDKLTGKVVWKTPRGGDFPESTEMRKSFCTPQIIDVDGQAQLISPGAQRVTAYDPDSGRALWVVQYSPGFSVVPRPVFGHGMLYICTGYMKPQLWAVRVGGQGDLTDTHVAWKVTRNVPANPSLLLEGNELYMVSDAGVATCLDAHTGQEIWRERLGDPYWASPLEADGRIYFWSELGHTTVIEPGRTFRKIAYNTLDGSIMATPAVVDSTLILRTETHLYRIGSEGLGR